MAILSKKQAGCSAGCIISKWIVAVLLLLATIAALIGVYETHVITGSDSSRVMIQFGSTSGSLAIIAFVVSVMAFGKKAAACMRSSCDMCNK